MIQQILKSMSPSGNALLGSGAVGATNTTSVASELNDKLWFYRVRRNANAAAATMYHDAGIAPPFHHLVDPTTIASQWVLTWENIIQGAVALGACRIFAGFIQFITTGTNSLCGIGFYADASDHKLHCFVNDCPTGAGAVTVRHDVDSGILINGQPRRLKFVIDGATKKISWYIDEALVDTFTPAAALDRMAPAADLVGCRIMFGAVVPANGDVQVRGYAGSLPTVRIGVGSLSALAPAATSRVYVGVGS